MSKMPEIEAAVKERILILDGGMGTMLQQYKLTEADYRGTEFANHHTELKGNNDLLCLTQPDIVREVHKKYLEAGADIVETNTFNAQAVSQAYYKLAHLSRRINLEATRLSREACDSHTKDTGRRCFVAGSLGPLNRNASIPPPSRVECPEYHTAAISFDEICHAYTTQAMALLDGGVDMVLIETIVDPLNAKAALFAVNTLFDVKGYARVPILVSTVTVTDGGRTLAGQTLDAFCASVRHGNLFSIGLNCTIGCAGTEKSMERLSEFVEDCLVSCYPNAGLPNPDGCYDETPEMMATGLKKFADAGWLNIVGGCCGTTPAHIKAIANACKGVAPRERGKKNNVLTISALESLKFTPEDGTMGRRSFFLAKLGDRGTISSSPEFNKMVNDGNDEACFAVACKQAEEDCASGVSAIHDPLHQSTSSPRTPVVARCVPLMLSCSCPKKFNAIESSLKCIPGRAIVNYSMSSLKGREDEEEFLRHARLIRRYGAALVVSGMFGDDLEVGATEFENKIRTCKRAYDLLVEKGDFLPEHIIFDPSMIALEGCDDVEKEMLIMVATWIKEELPRAKVMMIDSAGKLSSNPLLKQVVEGVVDILMSC